MSMRKRILGVWLALFAAFAMVCNQQAHAQAALAPLETFVINRAQAAILTRLAVARGIAASDPRIAATLAGMGKASTMLNVVGTGAAAALAFAGAPVWLTILAGMGILAVGSALQLGDAKFLWSGDQVSLDVDALPASIGDRYAPIQPPAAAIDPTRQKMLQPELWAARAGIPVYRNGTCQANNASCIGYPFSPGFGASNFYMSRGPFDILPSTLEQAQQFAWYLYHYLGHCGLNSGCINENDTNVHSHVLYFAPERNIPGNPIALHYTESRTVAIKSSGGRVTYRNVVTSGKDTLFQYKREVVPLVADDLAKLWPRIPSKVAAAPLPTSTITSLVNETWKNAASQPDYEGLPYQPVSEPDIAEWAKENPGQVPTVGDLFTSPARKGKDVLITPFVPPQPIPVPVPKPAPTPAPRPASEAESEPRPAPAPVPGAPPQPRPVPEPQPQPQPMPVPRPVPQPVPQPVPVPLPQPVPHPVPEPAPSPVPQPVPVPVPEPVPGPVPVPVPEPVPSPVPEPIPQPIPQPLPQPVPVPTPAPGTNPGTGRPSRDDICALHPEASACAPLGSASDVAVNSDAKRISLSPLSIGLTKGVCPEPKRVVVFGSELSFSYEPLCEFALKLRPLVLLLGALLAGVIFVTGLAA
ncbi:hypothetical protein J2A69_00855 [Burkholderia pseudomallei]|uniref:virulence factor TspB C-terminal domain-related protein n=2 Tax=Burkholderia pseudomallei TaxID=28450 RepID=UPI0010385F96|nr:virulence factor TspB C-terminal domain-related protein [Burkholderia pseudomallei]MBO3033057.1 hypothetical protein [Burkholderia pseudomallei]MBO7775606.1 hypothetical protein [Burkholderia pseudomallei]MBO7888918.1 hypothetical protein [Burkholderia pseudomallei]MBO7895432.1 hypothetical protein [Burkholderia pseudomallei]MBO7901118.1 hypothetical protein [Burkholderia pseudomallei]